MTQAPKRGRPEKTPGGLNETLFLRVAADLIARLDAVVARERARHPGRVITRADVAREFLYAATEGVET